MFDWLWKILCRQSIHLRKEVYYVNEDARAYALPSLRCAKCKAHLITHNNRY